MSVFIEKDSSVCFDLFCQHLWKLFGCGGYE